MKIHFSLFSLNCTCIGSPLTPIPGNELGRDLMNRSSWRPLEPDFYHCFSVKRTTNRDFRSKITRLISHQYSIMFGQSLIFKMHTQARKKCILFRKKGNENFLEGNINYR